MIVKNVIIYVPSGVADLKSKVHPDKITAQRY